MKIDLVAKRCVMDFWWEVSEKKLFLKPQLTFQQDGMVASSSHNRTGKRSQRSKTPQSSQHNNQNPATTTTPNAAVQAAAEEELKHAPSPVQNPGSHG